MDDGEDDSLYTRKAYDVDNQQGLGSSVRSNQKHPAHNEYVDDEEEDVEDEELAEGDEGVSGLRVIGKDNYDDDGDGDDDDDDEDDTDDDNDEDEDDDGTRPRKKRKLKNLISNYEFAPRLPAPAPAASAHQDAPSRTSSGRRNAGADWTERETFVLLDAWGEWFFKLGRKSLRLEDWQEVAERVSQETNIERTDTQCRNRLDTLKKKYRREKMKLETAGAGGVGCKWPFYRKMDMMLNPPPQQLRTSLSCGVDSGEYVFMDPKAYLNRANGLDEMRDSPGNSESWKDDGENISDGLPPNGKRNRGSRVGGSFRLLAESIQKFSEIYEKIEISKRKQMVELENMRMDFHRQLETQRRQILERAQAEIVKIRQGDEEDDDNDLCADD